MKCIRSFDFESVLRSVLCQVMGISSIFYKFNIQQTQHTRPLFIQNITVVWRHQFPPIPYNHFIGYPFTLGSNLRFCLLNCLALSYLAELPHPYYPSRCVRSTDQLFLVSRWESVLGQSSKAFEFTPHLSYAGISLYCH